MLNIYQLHLLPLLERNEYILENGKFINSKLDGYVCSKFYKMDKYEAEVVCNMHTNQVIQIILKQGFERE
jgi:hypothetical protein